MKANGYIDLNNLNWYAIHNSGLRFITTYNVNVDQLMTRIDFKINNRQYCVAFCSGKPSHTDKREPDSDMVSPNKAVENCSNIKANRDEILKALKELVSDIENDQVLEKENEIRNTLP